MGELGADDASVTVGAGDLAPDDSALVAALVSLLGLEDVSDTLADVELGVLLGLDTLDSEEGGAHVLVSLASLVAEEDSAGVESRHFCCNCRNEFSWDKFFSLNIKKKIVYVIFIIFFLHTQSLFFFLIYTIFAFRMLEKSIINISCVQIFHRLRNK